MASYPLSSTTPPAKAPRWVPWWERPRRQRRRWLRTLRTLRPRNAVAGTGLTSGEDVTTGSSATTASISPTSNRLVLLLVVSDRNGITTPTTPTASGNGLTWVQVATTTYGGSARWRATVFRALGASPSSGSITIDFGGENQAVIVWSVAEFDGVDTSGSNGSGAIVQSKTASSTTGTAATVTLDSSIGAGNATYGGAGDTSSNDSVRSPGSGYTELHDLGGSNSVTAGLISQWRAAGTTTVDATMYVGSVGWGIIGIEIKAAGGGGGGQAPRSLYLYRRRRT